jgi:methylmalonyl-CoA mutase N-terminal domain/subunit
MTSGNDRDRERWQKELHASKLREEPATTVSSMPIEPLYTTEDLAGSDFASQLGYPGQYPYTRGVHASMYRGRLWTMRQFAGF